MFCQTSVLIPRRKSKERIGQTPDIEPAKLRRVKLKQEHGVIECQVVFEFVVFRHLVLRFSRMAKSVVSRPWRDGPEWSNAEDSNSNDSPAQLGHRTLS